MEVFVSTVGRGKDLEESSKVYKIDLDTGKILAQVRLPLAMFDLKNPRGGTRGCRGLAIIPRPEGKELWAAGFDGLFNLDVNDLFVKKAYWFRSILDIHSIYHQDGRITAISTWNNSIFSVEPETGAFYQVRDLTNGFPNPRTLGTPDQYHLNATLGDLALLNRQEIVVDMKTKKVAFESPEFKSGHNLIPLPSGEIATCSSAKKTVLAFRPFTNEWRTILDLNSKYPFNDVPEGKLNTPGWTRGMSYHPEGGMLLVGAAPSSVIVVDPFTCEIKKTINISDDVLEATFSVIPA